MQSEKIKLIGLHEIPEFDYFGITLAQVLIYGGLVGRMGGASIAYSVVIRAHAKVPWVINNFEDVLGSEFEPTEGRMVIRKTRCLVGRRLCQGPQSSFVKLAHCA